MLVFYLYLFISERGVTANMPVLGTGDSGFESRRSDQKKSRKALIKLMSLTFIRTKEDFICEHCGFSVVGTGYTNHCPKCLWSKHVDTFPGDRSATCQGMMEPTTMQVEKGEFIITHTCVLCGYQKRNKADTADVLDSLINKIKIQSSK